MRNRMTDDVIIVPIFSTGRPGPSHVPIFAGTGGLPGDSVFFCEELTTIDRDFLTRGPPVPASLLERVIGAVVLAIGGE